MHTRTSDIIVNDVVLEIEVDDVDAEADLVRSEERRVGKECRL